MTMPNRIWVDRGLIGYTEKDVEDDPHVQEYTRTSWLKEQITLILAYAKVQGADPGAIYDVLALLESPQEKDHG